MKKTRIVVIALAILMLFAFVGCKENTVDEKVQATADFQDSFTAVLYLGNNFPAPIYAEELNSDLSMETYEESPDKVNALTIIIQSLVGPEDIDTTQLEIKSKKGTITYIHDETKNDKGEIMEDSRYLNAKDVEVEIEYKGSNRKISFSTILSQKSTGNGVSTTSINVNSLTLNGKTYKPIACTVVAGNGLFEFISATCKGKAVDLDILNGIRN